MKVLVAISGGPKSLVTAWLLKKQGMQVRGVYFDLIGSEKIQSKVEALERKLGISIQTLSAKTEFAIQFAEAREKAALQNETLDAETYFHQSFLIPKLFELRSQHQMDKVATGHRVLIQEDQVSKLFRVYQNADLETKDALFILGLDQKELESLVLPLGSIPQSMFTKLSQELDGGTESLTWDNHFESQNPDTELRFEVYAESGIRIGSYQSKTLPEPGMKFHSSDNPEAHYRFVEVLFHSAQVIASEIKDMGLQEIHFEDAHWFSRADLGLTVLTCSLVGSESRKPEPVRLLQYEGGRIKAFLKQPLRGEEANIFKGQTVLWVEGTEILGGGRVLGTR